MIMSTDWEQVEELKLRVAEKYTSAELVELLDIAIEDIIEAFEPRVLGSRLLLEDVGMLEDSEDDNGVNE